VRRKKGLVVTIVILLLWITMFKNVQAASSQSFETYVTLQLIDEENTEIAIKGATFSLYRYTGKEYRVIDKLVTDYNGNVRFTITKKGKYKIKQTATARDYVMSEEPYEVEFTIEKTKQYDGRVLNLSRAEQITNHERTGTITVYNGESYALYKKVGNDGLLGVLQAFLTGKTYEQVNFEDYSCISNEDGSETIEGLSCGSYYIVKLDEQSGLELSDSIYEFDLNSTSGYDVVFKVADDTVQMDTRIYIGVEDEQSGVPVAGGTYHLTGVFSDGSTEYKWKGTARGEEINGLLIPGNTYVLEQVKAVSGYQKVEEPIMIELDENGEIVSSEKEQSCEFIVRIQKEKVE
jgi:uncharacterized surface anchored protein